jgi:hypothetical protein
MNADEERGYVVAEVGLEASNKSLITEQEPKVVEQLGEVASTDQVLHRLDCGMAQGAARSGGALHHHEHPPQPARQG